MTNVPCTLIKHTHVCLLVPVTELFTSQAFSYKKMQCVNIYTAQQMGPQTFITTTCLMPICIPPPGQALGIASPCPM